MLRIPFFKNNTQGPENSVAFRTLIFTAQVVAFISVAYVTGLWLVCFVGTLLLAAGHIYSYQNRHNPKKFVRNAAFVALHMAICGLLTALFTSIPYPQVLFAVFVTGIVSFDYFKRLNLFSALGLGLANMYVAATLSRDSIFGAFLVAVLALSLAALWVADSQDGLKNSKVVLRAPYKVAPSRFRRNIAGWGLQFAVVLLMLASVAFMFTPRFAGRPLFMPMTIRAPIQQQPSAQIINPAVPLVRIEGTRSYSEEASEYYFGFADTLDLSYRGNLSSTIMMYVSSPAWSYWRGYAYDTFDGRTWRQSINDLEIIDSRYRANFLLDENPQAETFVQSFYIQQEMPNVLWAGGEPVEVFFPADQIARDMTGGIRLGESLSKGMIYSVISTRQTFAPDVLRSAGTDYPDEITALYLQLPDSTTNRTRELAHHLTAGLSSNYDKVIAIRDHLLTTYPYDYFPPPQAPNTDSVDQFLFEDQRGVCEHYVSAMVVMLRELGIPTRFVVGYGSGDFNRFTGYWEVRANDAHAWTEVYFPGHGWVPFDPTPGWNGDPQTGPVDTWVFSNMFSNVQMPEISFSVVGEAGAAVFGVVSGPLLIAGGLLVIMAMSFGVWRLWGHHGRKIRQYYGLDPVRRKIFAEYRRVQRKLHTTRLKSQTVQEHAQSHPQIAALATMVEQAAYSSAPIDEADLQKAQDWHKTSL